MLERKRDTQEILLDLKGLKNSMNITICVFHYLISIESTSLRFRFIVLA